MLAHKSGAWPNMGDSMLLEMLPNPTGGASRTVALVLVTALLRNTQEVVGHLSWMIEERKGKESLMRIIHTRTR